ncbi:uncharacterized protein LOC143151682 [Ptiloglossa arizonensis]|uniref:uncharacterized protein LOC143151682 n=1 Tax=Ptiloglossa arizonensis TaxID=3350558 RepID=UPI003F9FCABD
MTRNTWNQNYRNVHYNSDTDYTILVARTLLSPAGIWPLRKDDSVLHRVKIFAQIGTIFSSMCCLLVPHVIYTFHECEDLTRYMKVIAAQVFSVLGIVKFWTMIINRQEIGRCLRAMEVQYRDVECEKDRLVMRKSAKIGRMFTIMYLSLSYGGALPYHIILPFMSERVVKRDNTTQIPLPYLSNYVFFVIEDSPIYEMTFVLQMLISTVILSINTGINSLIATIVMHSCGLFKVVNRKLESFLEENNNDLRTHLNGIIQHHLKAIEFAGTIEKAFSLVFLSEMIGCTVIVCFLEYGVIVEWEDRKTFSTITYFILMTSIFVNVFILSFIGDRLKEESERVGEALYFIPWYDIPKDIADNMKMIILRSSHPTHLSAAKIFDLTLQAFCDVCKTSAAYLNFLRTMTNITEIRWCTQTYNSFHRVQQSLVIIVALGSPTHSQPLQTFQRVKNIRNFQLLLEISKVFVIVRHLPFKYDKKTDTDFYLEIYLIVECNDTLHFSSNRCSIVQLDKRVPRWQIIADRLQKIIKKKAKRLSNFESRFVHAKSLTVLLAISHRVVLVLLAANCPKKFFTQAPLDSCDMVENTSNKSYRNVHYKSDAEYTVRVAKTLLTPLGIWPLYKRDSFLQKVKTFVRIGAIFSLMCFLLIPHVIYTFHDSKNLARYMKVIAAQVFSLLGIIKFWTMIINRKAIRKCLTAIEVQYKDVECEKDRSVMTDSAKIGRLFTIAYLSLSYGGALPYHIILPFMSEKVVNRENITQIPLPYESNYLFFVVEDSPFYEIMFASQILISTTILSTNTGISSLIATSVMHTCGLFKVVNRKIETFFEDNTGDLHKRLNGIIRHHLTAIEFAGTIEKVLSTVFLSEMIGCTIIICFLEYGVIVEWEERKTLSMLTYFILMTSIFVNVFIISLIGDLLKQESEKVGETLYFTPWYNLPKDIADNMKMIILRTSRPTNLSAAKIFDLSLQAFCDVCKTSAAYLNFLRTMAQ